MAVGISTNKMTLDSQSGMLAQQIQTWSRSATSLEGYLAGATEADLIALGYTSDDVALLKSAVHDMAQLASIFFGETTQDPAYDFRTFVARIGGIVL